MLKLIKKIVKGNNHYTLIAFNLIILSATIYGLIFLSFDPWLFLLTMLTYFIMISFGISITYHRTLTHKSLVMHPILEKFGVLVASLAGTGSPIMWVLTHRQHHRYSDKERDPHPPGKVWKTFFGNYARVETTGIKDIAFNEFNRFLHRYYFAVVASWGLLLLGLFGFEVVFYVFILTTLFNITISNALNWFGHKASSISYRSYELRDQSQNNIVMAFLAFGEGWHNNHHRFPGSAKFSVKSTELDISYLIIKILSKIGLIHSVKIHGS